MNNYLTPAHSLDFSAILAAIQSKKPSVVQIRAEDVGPRRRLIRSFQTDVNLPPITDENPALYSTLLQLAARWSDLIVDRSSFRTLDPTKWASKATAWTLGAHWFLNRNALIRFDYEDVPFVGGAGTVTGTGVKSVYHIANRPTERVISTRFQISF